jgi:mannan endo-1,4-beta-mannosidase
LDGVADALAELGDAGVVVLWRPFHEMNGGWFWWGRRDPADYVAVWRHMFDYFTKTKKLNNLLWVYSPSTTKSSPVIAYYPGDAYCDIVGLDHYAEGFDLRGYAELTATGKPFGITEIGPQRSLRGSYDYAELIVAIQERYPKTVFFQAWAWDWSLSRNKNAAAMLADPWVIGRDELPRRDTQ